MIEHDKHLQMNFLFQCNYKFINKFYIHYLILLEITEIVVQMSTNKEFKSPKKRKRNAYWQQFASDILTAVAEFDF